VIFSIFRFMQITLNKQFVASYELCEWKSRINAMYLNSKERLLSQTKYKACVPAQISEIQIKLDKEVEELFNLALEDIVRFDSLIKEKVIAMPAVLLRSESASSSQIERLTASAKNIAIAEIGGHTKDNAAGKYRRNKWFENLKARRDSVVWKVVDYLFEQPVINAQAVSLKFGVADISARAAIDALLKAGIIKQIKEQKRNVLYFANEITDIMDIFSKNIAIRK